MVKSKPSWGKWRERIWPFHRSDYKKLLPLTLMKFLISINYGILTSLKDTVVVTAKGSGAEVIPVLKGWIVLPIAMLAAIAYSKLSNVLNKGQLFYTILGFFLFVIFCLGFILYPNAEALSPHASSDWLMQALGPKAGHWVAVYRNWIPSLLFVTAEMWAALVIFMLFWGFANDVTSVEEAKKSYNLYIAAGNLAAFCIGPIVYFVTKKLCANSTSFLPILQILIAITLVVGLLTAFLHWWTTRYVGTNNDFKPLKTKTKLSLRQGFKQLIRSRYLLSIAIIVVGYGFAVSLIEVTWKGMVKLEYPNPADYQSFTSTATSCVGLAAFITSLFFGTGIIRFFGWHFSAQITPILVGSTGILFFLAILFKDHISFITNWFSLTPLAFIVILGAIQNIISKTTKYSFF